MMTPASSVGKKTKYRIKDGIKYVYHKTYTNVLDGKAEVDKIKLAGRKAIVYNHYYKRSFIVFVEEVKNVLE